MGKGTVLRVRDDIELSTTFIEHLRDVIGDFKIQRYGEKRDLVSIYRERIDELHKAFHFILDAYPPNKSEKAADSESLRKYAQRYRNECTLSEPSIETLQRTLARFAARLVTQLLENWEWRAEDKTELTEKDQIKAAVACLNDADQYVLMRRGAENIATLTPMTVALEQRYTLQWDERLPSHSKLWLAELEKIKEQHAPETPQMFRTLKEVQQTYFCHLDPSIRTASKLKIDFNAFYLFWLQLKTNPESLSSGLKEIAQGSFPAWFKSLSLSQQKMLLALADKSIGEITEELKAFDSLITDLVEKEELFKSLRQTSTLPYWYWLLPQTQQKFLGYLLKHSDSIEEVTSFLPSRLRWLPALPNFRAHQLLILDKEGKVKKASEKRFGSSHIVSRDVLYQPKEIQRRHASENLEKLFSLKKPEQFILVQTLISPVPILEYIPSALGDIPPDYGLAETLKETIASKRDERIVYINHPMNIAKTVFYTESTDPACLALLNAAKHQFKENTPEWFLAQKYETVLNSGFGSATMFDWNGRELFLSSYEELLTMALDGISYGSCVSGKDRKSIEFIHTDAMLRYREIYHRWPDFYDGDKERQNFVDIVVDVYASYHAHALAKQNGADGIKTPAKYWPQDIAEAIKKRLGERRLVEDDRIATNIEVSRIAGELYTYYKSEEACRDACKNAAFLLGETNCQGLIDALGILVEEKKRFLAASHYLLFSSAPMEPKGISNIRDLIKNHSNEKKKFAFATTCDHFWAHSKKHSAVAVAADIFYVISQRPEADGNRSETTKTLYRLLRDLSNPAHKAPEKFAEILNELKALTKSSFEANRSYSDPEFSYSDSESLEEAVFQ